MHYIALHYIALHCITLYYNTLYCLTLHCIALKHTSMETGFNDFVSKNMIASFKFTCHEILANSHKEFYYLANKI